VLTAQEIFVGTRTLRAALDLEWAVAWPDLEVTLLDPTSLPIARRLRREALLASPASGGPEFRAVSRPAAVSIRGLVVDYSPGTDHGRRGIRRHVLGLDVFGAFSSGCKPDGRRSPPQTPLDRQLAQPRLTQAVGTASRPDPAGAASVAPPEQQPIRSPRSPAASHSPASWAPAGPRAYRGGRLIGRLGERLGQFSFDAGV
jgi:hypothetical protein